jgi:protein-tyrosine-phosphatase
VIVAVMREAGVDISRQQTKAVNRFLGRRFSSVVKLCDRDKASRRVRDIQQREAAFVEEHT